MLFVSQIRAPLPCARGGVGSGAAGSSARERQGRARSTPRPRTGADAGEDRGGLLHQPQPPLPLRNGGTVIWPGFEINRPKHVARAPVMSARLLPVAILAAVRWMTGSPPRELHPPRDLSETDRHHRLSMTSQSRPLHLPQAGEADAPEQRAAEPDDPEASPPCGHGSRRRSVLRTVSGRAALSASLCPSPSNDPGSRSQ